LKYRTRKLIRFRK